MKSRFKRVFALGHIDVNDNAALILVRQANQNCCNPRKSCNDTPKVSEKG